MLYTCVLPLEKYKAFSAEVLFLRAACGVTQLGKSCSLLAVAGKLAVISCQEAHGKFAFKWSRVLFTIAFAFCCPRVTLCWPSFAIAQLLHGNYSCCEYPSAHRWQLHGAMRVEQRRTGWMSRTWKCNHRALLACFGHRWWKEAALPFSFSLFPVRCAVVGKPSEFGWKMDLGRRKVFINQVLSLVEFIPRTCPALLGAKGSPLLWFGSGSSGFSWLSSYSLSNHPSAWGLRSSLGMSLQKPVCP